MASGAAATLVIQVATSKEEEQSSVNLGPLYHWSPKERRQLILRGGLSPSSEPTMVGGRIGYVCLGTSPRGAWMLSGDLEWAEGVSEWDLWQVTLSDTDEVRVRPNYGPKIDEVKVHNVIPPDRVWWAGEREPWLTASGIAD